MKYIFGIDGGGTLSRMRITDVQNRVYAEAEGNSTNIYSVGTEAALQNVRQLIQSACAIAGIAVSELSAGCMGSAGLMRIDEIAIFRSYFEESFSKHIPIYICNDGEILLVGKLHSKQGYCLISGTGSLALGRSSNGETVRAGGLGHMLGDEGSGSWIGWEAIKRTLRSMENRDLVTGMLPALLEHFALHEPRDFVTMTHQHFQKHLIASAAPLVVDYAEHGDGLALDICSQATNELFMLIQSVIRRLPLQGTIALAGGVLENCALIRNTLSQLLSPIYPSLTITQGKGTALDGACLLASELCGASNACD